MRAAEQTGTLWQVVAGGVDSMLQEAAPTELAQLRDAVLSLVSQPREAEGVILARPSLAVAMTPHSVIMLLVIWLLSCNEP